MARSAAQGPDSFPSVLGPRPTAKRDATPPEDEETRADLALPKLPPPKLAVFGPPSPGAATERPNYRLGRVLGTGGIATVYEAYKDGADGFRKRVAVKRIHGHLAQDARVIELFGDEARLCSLIQHPNVCQVLDFVDDGSASFIVMELLEGSTLLHAFRALRHEPERLAWPRHQLLVARIIAGLAEGLHAAHELEDEHGASLQVVHRDVTPHNLFVLKSGAVKVADFGIARARSHVHQTDAGVTKGKLAYMAPEQLQGAPVDRRTDIFSLGVVTWEMLTGERLFQRSTEAKTLAALQSGEVPDPCTRQKAISPEIAAAVLKAVNPDPHERFRSAREMSRALDRAIAKSGDSVSNSDIADWIAELGSVATAERSTVKSALALPEQTASVHTADLQEVTRAAREAASAQPAPKRRGWPAVTAIIALTTVGGALLAWSATRGHGSAPKPAVSAAAIAPPAAATPRAETHAAPTPKLEAQPDPTLKPEAQPEARTAPSATPTTTAPVSVAKTPRASATVATPAAPTASAVASAQPEAASVPTGIVVVAVKGAPSEILIEGRTYAANRAITLPIGPHRITVVRQSDHVGSREIEVNVERGATSLIPVTIPDAELMSP